jgi:hypothetical protein
LENPDARFAEIPNPVGHLECAGASSLAVHEVLAQRIAMRHHMAALTRDELSSELAHQLRRAEHRFF